MSARGLAALVVGLGGGYLKGKDRQRREDIEDEDRAYTMTQRAQQLRIGSMQEQVAKLQLSAGERAELKAKFADQINPLADFGQLGEFMSASAADGQGGKLKMQFVPAADGKTVALNMVNPDGSLKPTARTFDNDGKGLALAKAQLNGMPPEKMLEHFHREAVEARAAAAQQSTEKYQAGMLKNAQDKTASQIENAGLRTQLAMQGAAAKAAGASGQGGIDMGAADKFITPLFITKDENTQATTFNPIGANTVRSLVLSMPAAQSGDTQGAVNQALAMYQAALKRAGGDHEKAAAEIQAAAARAQAKKAPSNPSGPAASPPPAPAAPAAPTMQARAKANAPSYEGWMAAKKRRDTLIQQAQAMSPDRREAWLQSRLPAAEQAIAFHADYLKN